MTRPRPVVLAIITTILALAGATAAYAAPHDARSASARPTANLAAVSKRCGVVSVVLHGAKAPTVTCVSRTRPAIPAHRIAGVDAVTLGNCKTATLFVAAAPVVLLQRIRLQRRQSHYWQRRMDPVFHHCVDEDLLQWRRQLFNVSANGANDVVEWFIDAYGNVQNVALTQVCLSCSYHS